MATSGARGCGWMQRWTRPSPCPPPPEFTWQQRTQVINDWDDIRCALHREESKLIDVNDMTRAGGGYSDGVVRAGLSEGGT